MKYLRTKIDQTDTNTSTCSVFIKDEVQNQKLPDNWTLEFFINSSILQKSSVNIPLFDMKVFNTNSDNESLSVIKLYIESTEVSGKYINKYSFQLDEKTYSMQDLPKAWDHIAIVYAKNCSVILYLNGNAILGKNEDELTFKDYSKFDKFLFTMYKGDIISYFTGIKVYSSIKYNKSGFTVTYPSSNSYNSGGSNGNNSIIDSNDDNIIITDPEIITYYSEDSQALDIVNLDFENEENFFNDKILFYQETGKSSGFSINEYLEKVELDYNDDFGVKMSCKGNAIEYRFSNIVKVLKDFKYYVTLNKDIFESGFTIDILMKSANTGSVILEFITPSDQYGAFSSIDSINELDYSKTYSSSSVYNSKLIIYHKGFNESTGQNTIPYRTFIIYSTNNSEITHYMISFKNNIGFMGKINGNDFQYYLNKNNKIVQLDEESPNSIFNANSYISNLLYHNRTGTSEDWNGTKAYDIYISTGGKKILDNTNINNIRLILHLKTNDYIKFFRVSKHLKLNGSFDFSKYLFGIPSISSQVDLSSEDYDKVISSDNNIQLRYPIYYSNNNSLNSPYNRGHSGDYIHEDKRYFIMEPNSTSDIDLVFKNDLSYMKTYPKSYITYPSIITKSNNNNRNLIKFRNYNPIVHKWTFSCWFYIKVDPNISDTDRNTYYEILYLTELSNGYIGLKIMPKGTTLNKGNSIIICNKLNSFTTNLENLILDDTGNSSSNNTVISDSILLNDWNHLFISRQPNCTSSTSYTSSFISISTRETIFIQLNNCSPITLTSSSKVENMYLRYLHRIILVTNSLQSPIIPIYTGIKIDSSDYSNKVTAESLELENINN